MLLTFPPLFPTKIISTLAVASSSRSSPEQVMMVPLRSAVVLSVDIVEISGRDELLFSDLETLRMVSVVIIGATIRIVPIYESSLSNVL